MDWEDRPEPADGGPVKVWVAIEMLKLSEIDNVKSTAQIQLDVNLVRAPCTTSAALCDIVCVCGAVVSNNCMMLGISDPSVYRLPETAIKVYLKIQPTTTV